MVKESEPWIEGDLEKGDKKEIEIKKGNVRGERDVQRLKRSWGLGRACQNF